MKKKTYELSNGKTIEQPRSWSLVILVVMIIFTYISSKRKIRPALNY